MYLNPSYWDFALYPYIPASLQNLFRREKRDRMVKYAVKNSPFYRELYKGVDFSDPDYFKKLPPVTKKQIMEEFDRVVCVPGVTLESVKSFISDDGNKNKMFAGNLKILTTSGSTGEPLVYVADKNHRTRFHYASWLRMGALSEYPSVTMAADNGFFIGNTSFRDSGDPRIPFIDTTLPIGEIVSRLNSIAPKQIHSYTSTLEILAREQQAGRLNIHPKVITASAEPMSPGTRKLLSETFGCRVYSVYSSTETGHIATDCDFGHMHFCDDGLVIEAVDENYDPVPDGEEADKMLITNLSNFAMPLIRYEVCDRVTVHRDGCPCKSKLPWIEVRGRTSVPNLTFKRDGREIVIQYWNIPDADDRLKTAAMQVIRHGQHKLEFRIIPAENIPFETVREKYLRTFGEYFALNGLPDVEIVVSDENPVRDPRSSKMPCVIEYED